MIKKYFAIIFSSFFCFQYSFADCRPETISKQARTILKLAEAGRKNRSPENTERVFKSISRESKLLSKCRDNQQMGFALLGGWKEAWSNEDLSKNNVDPNQIYQVYFPGNYYYSISSVQKNSKKLTTYLRGSFEPNEGGYRIQIIKWTYNYDWLPDGTNMLEQSMQAENGAHDSRQYPVQPVVFTFVGQLKPIYVDSKIAILSVDGSWLLAGDSLLFVLTRNTYKTNQF